MLPKRSIRGTPERHVYAYMGVRGGSLIGHIIRSGEANSHSGTCGLETLLWIQRSNGGHDQPNWGPIADRTAIASMHQPRKDQLQIVFSVFSRLVLDH